MIISDYTSVVKEVSKSLVTITGDEGKTNSVTGVVITETGVILTNYSRIKDMEHLNVIFHNDEQGAVDGKLVLKDEEFDLALIKVDYKGNIIAETSMQNPTALVALSIDKLNQFRSAFPVWKDADRFTIE